MRRILVLALLLISTVASAAELVSVNRPGPNWGWWRIEVTYSGPPTAADLDATVVTAPGREPVRMTGAEVSGNTAVAYCPWDRDAHWIVASDGASEVCGQYGEPSGDSPCVALPGAAPGVFYVERPLNAGDLGTFALFYALGRAIDAKLEADSTLVGTEYVLDAFGIPLTWTLHIANPLRDCASDTLLIVLTPAARAALTVDCDQ